MGGANDARRLALSSTLADAGDVLLDATTLGIHEDHGPCQIMPRSIMQLRDRTAI